MSTDQDTIRKDVISDSEGSYEVAFDKKELEKLEKMDSLIDQRSFDNAKVDAPSQIETTRTTHEVQTPPRLESIEPTSASRAVDNAFILDSTITGLSSSSFSKRIDSQRQQSQYAPCINFNLGEVSSLPPCQQTPEPNLRRVVSCTQTASLVVDHRHRDGEGRKQHSLLHNILPRDIYSTGKAGSTTLCVNSYPSPLATSSVSPSLCVERDRANLEEYKNKEAQVDMECESADRWKEEVDIIAPQPTYSSPSAVGTRESFSSPPLMMLHIERLRFCGPLVGYAFRDHSHQPLFQACQTDDVDAASRMLMSMQVHPNMLDDCGMSPLMLAILFQSIGVVKVLLSYGANPNFRVKECHPLLVAVEFETRASVEIVQTLLNNRASLNSRELSMENDALMIAVSTGNVGMVRCLLEYKADPNKFNLDGKSTMRIAVDVGNVEVVSMLVDSKATDKPSEKSALTGLQVACRNGQGKVAMLLLRGGSGEPTRFLGMERSALEYAARHGHYDLLRSMLDFIDQGSSSKNANVNIDENVESIPRSKHYFASVNQSHMDCSDSVADQHAERNLLDTHYKEDNLGPSDCRLNSRIKPADRRTRQLSDEPLHSDKQQHHHHRRMCVGGGAGNIQRSEELTHTPHRDHLVRHDERSNLDRSVRVCSSNAVRRKIRTTANRQDGFRGVASMMTNTPQAVAGERHRAIDPVRVQPTVKDSRLQLSDCFHSDGRVTEEGKVCRTPNRFDDLVYDEYEDEVDIEQDDEEVYLDDERANHTSAIYADDQSVSHNYPSTSVASRQWSRQTQNRFQHPQQQHHHQSLIASPTGNFTKRPFVAGRNQASCRSSRKRLQDVKAEHVSYDFPSKRRMHSQKSSGGLSIPKVPM